jgi:hypothetical protein
MLNAQVLSILLAFGSATRTGAALSPDLVGPGWISTYPV